MSPDNKKQHIAEIYFPPTVKGYTKRDGIYVVLHQRITLNRSKWDNRSTIDNGKPHTGEKGTKAL